MLHLMQVINYMISHLEYTEAEVVAHFEAVLAGELTALELLDILGLEFAPHAMDRFETKMPLYKSALAVIKMQLEAA